MITAISGRLHLAFSLEAAWPRAASLREGPTLNLQSNMVREDFIFECASRMLDKIKDDPKPEWTAVQILEKLGQEALQEQAEWLWLRHTRPFEVPAA